MHTVQFMLDELSDTIGVSSVVKPFSKIEKHFYGFVFISENYTYLQIIIV